MNLHPKTTPGTKEWCDDLVLELRLRDVRGARIGEEVASVESHCAEAGLSAQEAFGDVRQYAAALEFDPRDVESGTSTAGLLLHSWPTFAGLVGFYLATWVATAWHAPGPVIISHGQLIGFALTLSAIAVAVRFLEAVVRHVVLFVVIYVVAITLTVVAAVLWGGPLFHVPAPALALLGAAFLALSVVGEYRHGNPADPVVDPVRGLDRYPSGRPRLTRALAVARPWFWPLAAAVVGAITILVTP